QQRTFARALAVDTHRAAPDELRERRATQVGQAQPQKAVEPLASSRGIDDDLQAFRHATDPYLGGAGCSRHLLSKKEPRGVSRVSRPMVSAEKRDYYEVLGVERACGSDDLKRAYKLLAI